MHLLKLLLEEYQPTHEETQFKKDMLSFLEMHKNCFERACLKGHFTASSWLLNKEEDAFLLLHHRKLDCWLQLGGHCDGDEDTLGVAIKEAQEESGINDIVPISQKIFDIDIHNIPQYQDVPAHLHLDIRFLLKVNSDEKIVQNHESKALKWFKKDDTLPTNERSVIRMYYKWLKN